MRPKWWRACFGTEQAAAKDGASRSRPAAPQQPGPGPAGISGGLQRLQEAVREQVPAAAAHGRSWLGRLSKSVESVTAILGVDASGAAVLTRASGGELRAWSLLAVAGPQAQHLEGLDWLAQQPTGTNSTSYHLLDSQGVKKAPVVMSLGSGGCTVDDLPADWRMLSQAGIKGFCALPLPSGGDHLVGVLSFFWTSGCPVPPAMRPGTSPGSDAFSAPPSDAEVAMLQQLGQFFAFGLLSGSHDIVYALKVARMLSAIERATGLQAALDALIGSSRDVVQHKCQLQLGCVVAVPHPSLPSAAFIVESNPAAPGAPLFRRNTQSGHGGRTASGPLFHLPSGLQLPSGPSGSGSSGLTNQTFAAQPSRLWPGSKALIGHGRHGSLAMYSSTTGGQLSLMTPLTSGEWLGDGGEAGPVHAHLTSLMCTLLQLSLHRDGGGPAAAICADSASRRRSIDMTAAAAEVDMAAAGPWAAFGAAAADVQPTGCVVPSCTMHLQDELLPCRDVVLCQKLLSGQQAVQALVLAVAQDDTPGTHTRRRNRSVAEHAVGTPSAMLSSSPTSSAVLPQMATGATTTTGTARVSTSGSRVTPSLALYLASADPLPDGVLQGVKAEAHELLQLALPVLGRRIQSTLYEEWACLLDVLSTRTSQPERITSSKILRPGSLADYNGSVINEVGGLGDHLTHGSTVSRAASRRVSAVGVSMAGLALPPRVESLQVLDVIVSSFQSSLSAVQLADAYHPDSQELRMSDIGAVDLLEVVGRGGQGVVFRGLLHGLEAAVKVIANKEDAALGAAAAPATALAAAAGRPAHGGGPSALGGGGSVVHVDEFDEARMLRERKRSMLRDALELAVTASISHPNIVQMFCYFTDVVVVEYGAPSKALKLLPVEHESLAAAGYGPGGAAAAAAGGAAASSGASAPGQDGATAGPLQPAPAVKKPTTNTVMCMEYCDAGTLKSAAEAGAFRQPGVSAKTGPACPALVPLYTSLLEVAMALRHLHGRRLVHCDLKPANVLLKSSTRDPRGWVCKLSDFGCVRMLSELTSDGRLAFRQPQPVGTVTHMAAEMFVKSQLLDSSVDVYSFGIVMWELIMVAPLYDGTVPREKLPALIRRGLRPVFHPLVPNEYKLLASACWADDPRRRPTASALVSALQRLLVRAQANNQQAGPGGVGQGAYPPAAVSAPAGQGQGSSGLRQQLSALRRSPQPGAASPLGREGSGTGVGSATLAAAAEARANPATPVAAAGGAASPPPPAAPACTHSGAAADPSSSWSDAVAAGTAGAAVSALGEEVVQVEFLEPAVTSGQQEEGGSTRTGSSHAPPVQ